MKISKLYIVCIIIILLFGCEKDELYRYPYEPDQAITLQIDVYPAENVFFDLERLKREINADYLNRYGMAAELTIINRIGLPNNIIGRRNLDGVEGTTVFLPQTPNDSRYHLNLWVLPRVNMPTGVAGYAINQHNMVVSESSIYGTTPTHEIGHLLGLRHVELENNVMRKFGNSKQSAKPREFVEQQIDTMTSNLVQPMGLHNRLSVIYN